MNRIQAFLARVGAPDPAPPWSLPTALISVGFAFLAMIVGSGVAVVWAGGQDYAELAGWTLGGMLILLFVWQTRRREWDALHLVGSSTPILFVMFVAFGCAVALDLLSLAVTGEFLTKPEFLGLTPSTLSILEWGFAAAFMIFVQPMAEGLIFRGITLPAMRQLAGAWGGMILTATLTGVFHYLLYPPNYPTASTLTPLWYGLIIPALEAVVFSMVRGYTNSTRASIAAHLTFGLFAVLKLLTLGG